MPVGWMDIERVLIDTILRSELCQLRWFREWMPQADLAFGLQANPHAAWAMR